jgi:hypothetical protein
VDEMKRKGIKARNINIDMPLESVNDFSHLFNNAERIMLPNGKIFISSEQQGVLEHAARLARNHGLKARMRKEMPQVEAEGRTHYTIRHSPKPIYRLEITFGLKKALPKKEQRKNWPRN